MDFDRRVHVPVTHGHERPGVPRGRSGVQVEHRERLSLPGLLAWLVHGPVKHQNKSYIKAV